MPRPRAAGLTDGELRIMHVLWDRQRATVAEVVDAIEGPAKPAYNTVLTLLRILEDKGAVTHEKVGRAFVYLPRVGREDARQNALSSMVSRLFDNRPSLVVANLIEQGELDAADVDELRALLDEAREKPRAGARRTARR